MMKKVLILTAIVGFSFQGMAAKSKANSSNRSSSKTICQINSGDTGLIKYRSSSYEEAFEKVTEMCFQRRQNMFTNNRNQEPDQDRQILFVESCLNSVECV